MLSWADESGEAHAPPPIAAREPPDNELQAPSPRAGAVIDPPNGAPNALSSDHTIDQADFFEHLSDEDTPAQKPRRQISHSQSQPTPLRQSWSIPSAQTLTSCRP